MIRTILTAARLLHALHDGLIRFAESWVESAPEGCGHDHDCGDDPDGPDDLTYHLSGIALHSLLEDAGIEAANGSSPSEAADHVIFQVEMCHIEAGVDE